MSKSSNNNIKSKDRKFVYNDEISDRKRSIMDFLLGKYVKSNSSDEFYKKKTSVSKAIKKSVNDRKVIKKSSYDCKIIKMKDFSYTNNNILVNSENIIDLSCGDIDSIVDDIMLHNDDCIVKERISNLFLCKKKGSI